MAYGYPIAALAAYLGGGILIAVAGFPLDSFVLLVLTVLVVIGLVAAAIAARRALLPMFFILIFWLGVASFSFGFGGV